jgi:hypothetical protein
LHNSNAFSQPHDPDIPIIYTAIFGGKDQFFDSHDGIDGWRHICFTDNPDLRSDQAEVIFAPGISKDPRRSARFFKILPHVHLPPAKFSVWIDGSIQIGCDQLDKLVEDWFVSGDVASLTHPSRSCVYDEASAVIDLYLDQPRLVRRQMEVYRDLGLPEHHGLHQTQIVARRHDLREVKLLGEIWWNMVVKYSRRDQLSFDFARWQADVTVRSVDAGAGGTPPFYNLLPHAQADDLSVLPLTERAHRKVSKLRRTLATGNVKSLTAAAKRNLPVRRS